MRITITIIQFIHHPFPDQRSFNRSCSSAHNPTRIYRILPSTTSLSEIVRTQNDSVLPINYHTLKTVPFWLDSSTTDNTRHSILSTDCSQRLHLRHSIILLSSHRQMPHILAELAVHSWLPQSSQHWINISDSRISSRYITIHSWLS